MLVEEGEWLTWKFHINYNKLFISRRTNFKHCNNTIFVRLERKEQYIENDWFGYQSLRAFSFLYFWPWWVSCRIIRRIICQLAYIDVQKVLVCYPWKNYLQANNLIKIIKEMGKSIYKGQKLKINTITQVQDFGCLVLIVK